MSSPNPSHSPVSQRGRQIAPRRYTRFIALALCFSTAWLWAETHSWLGQVNASVALAAQTAADVQPLEVGKPLGRELAGGQSHSFQITLIAGQYLHIITDQRGIDVEVVLFGPEGKELTKVDSPNGTEGPEPLMWITKSSGSYRLEIRSLEKEATAGRYEVKIVDLRAATEADLTLAEAFSLSTEAEALGDKGKYGEAIPLAERALTLREKVLGLSHLDVAASLNNLGILYQTKGDYVKAEPVYQRALAIREKTLNSDHLDIAESLNNLAGVYLAKGDYLKAEPLLQRTLEIREKMLGLNHQDVAFSLSNLAALYHAEGDYAKAEPILQRALAIYEKELGPSHLDITISLNNLAQLYYTKGDYVKAEPLFQRALAIREKGLDPNHPDIAISLSNLAFLYHDKGDYAKAEPLFQRALAINEKVLDPNHSDIAVSLNNLALLYHTKGDYAKAEPLFQRALAIREKAFGPNHKSVATQLNNLAALYRSTGDYAKAEPVHQRALSIREQTLGFNHPDVAMSLHNLAYLYYDKGDYGKAEPLFQRALAINAKALSAEHPEVVKSLNGLAQLYVSTREIAKAIEIQLRACLVSEHNLALNLATGSERQKLALLAQFISESDRTVSMHVRTAPTNVTARSLALAMILQRKGRALDAMTDSIAALRRRANPSDQALLDQLQAANAQLARLVLNGTQKTTPEEHQKQIKALEEQKEKLEAEISTRSAEFRAQSQAVTLTAVQSAIPANAALVEFFAYRPFNAKYTKEAEQFGAARYVVYVLRHEGEAQWVELGEAKAIDAAVEKLRQALRDKRRADVKQLARAVDKQVMQPVRALLGQTRRVFIAPDGVLNLIPFAVLVDQQGNYLVRHYEFSYLTSGRDLLRLQVKQPSKRSAMVVANPDFGEATSAETAAPRSFKLQYQRAAQAATADSFTLANAYFPPLPGTAGEARALKSLLPGVTVLTGAQATEAALKQMSSPDVLHIATHGFFLSDLAAGNGGGRELKQVGPALDTPINQQIENPLLRSGLALSGANLHKSGDDDGVLTALEAAGLDLWGTKLVVLSACDTGVGEVKSGDGVYGLRRALVLAGSESQVMSLWPVSDTGTRDLMIEYYKALQAKQGRSKGLRQVQLKLLASAKRQHPYYWASFIQSGEWANLEGKR